MEKFIYKADSDKTLEAMDYVIRFREEDYPKGFAKVKGGNEFKTDFTVNNTGYDVYRMGREISKEEYEIF